MTLKLHHLTSKNFADLVRESSEHLPDADTIKMLEGKGTEETVLYILGILTPEGRMVGFGMYASGPWDPILKPGYADVTIKVDQDWYHQGVGNWLLDEIETLARERHSKALQTMVRDNNDVELDWVNQKGFEITNHSFESRLNVKMFDIHSYDALFKNLEASGIKFTSLAEYTQDPDIEHQFWDFWWKLVQDVPGMSDKPRPDNEKMMNMTRDVDKEGFILAVDDGTWVAMSMAIDESEGVVYNSMTGVDRRYRGKGLAQAVKVKAIEYALKNDAEYMRTHNDSENEAMLSVNEKLGYERRPGIFGLTKLI
ncbi:GNAT family N-acetyltransferase [Lentibacillus sp. JNUCC-1]|uniref:GNAT family N-acetyltransferase n=1 Tax=Lentibacillus sp. JNUCC-1 TaxID=2654513 RepID=UPI0018D25B34|nr:GNAT family N-acetyltransferase [Lentibacillus sp. JNUCC-1]